MSMRNLARLLVVLCAALLCMVMWLITQPVIVRADDNEPSGGTIIISPPPAPEPYVWLSRPTPSQVLLLWGAYNVPVAFPHFYIFLGDAQQCAPQAHTSECVYIGYTYTREGSYLLDTSLLGDTSANRVITIEYRTDNGTVIYSRTRQLPPYYLTLPIITASP